MFLVRYCFYRLLVPLQLSVFVLLRSSPSAFVLRRAHWPRRRSRSRRPPICTAAVHAMAPSSRAGIESQVPTGTLLLRNIGTLATMNRDLGEISCAAVFIRGRAIEWVGKQSDLPADLQTADQEVDLAGCVAVPGGARAGIVRGLGGGTAHDVPVGHMHQDGDRAILTLLTEARRCRHGQHPRAHVPGADQVYRAGRAAGIWFYAKWSIRLLSEVQRSTWRSPSIKKLTPILAWSAGDSAAA